MCFIICVALKSTLKAVAPAAIGSAAAIVGAPLAVGALGFGAGGIGAGTAAAKMMSLAWTSSYGVGLVSALQSVGAAGFSLQSIGALGAAGAGLGFGAQKLCGNNGCEYIFICRSRKSPL